VDSTNSDALNVGSKDSSGDEFASYIREVVVTNIIDTATRQKLEGYLAWKWNLVANLPVGHPYKNSPP
jgi:hypothetical protein